MEHSPIAHPEAIALAEIGALRSDFLDAFSDLERKVDELIAAAGKTAPKAQHFGARLELFKALEGIPQIAKANYPLRDRIAAEIADLLPVRADIVHSRVRPCLIDGVASGIFVNSHARSQPFPPCRVLSGHEIAKLTSEVLAKVDAIKRLGRLITPAS